MNLGRTKEAGRENGRANPSGNQEIHAVFGKPTGKIPVGDVVRDAEETGEELHLAAVRMTEETEVKPVQITIGIPVLLRIGDDGRIMAKKNDVITGRNLGGDGFQIGFSGKSIVETGDTDRTGADLDLFDLIDQRCDAGIGHGLGKKGAVLIIFAPVSFSRDTENSIARMNFGQLLEPTEEKDRTFMVRSVITAEKNQIRPERIDFHNEIVQIGIAEPETPMNIAEIDNTQMIGIGRKIIRMESDFIRREDSGLDERINNQGQEDKKGQDDPDATAPVFDQMAGAPHGNGRGGGDGPGGGRRMFSAVFVHDPASFRPSISDNPIIIRLKRLVFKVGAEDCK